MDQPLRPPAPFPGRTLCLTRGVIDQIGDVVAVLGNATIGPRGLVFEVSHYSQDGKPLGD